MFSKLLPPLAVLLTAGCVGSALTPAAQAKKQAARGSGAVLKYSLRRVADPGMGNMAAYTYLMPQGWRNEDTIQWVGAQQPYSLAVLATKSPDGRFALGCYPAMFGVGYSGPGGRGGTWFRNAEDAVRTLIGKSPTITNFKVLDRMAQPLKSGYGAVAGARPSADMAVLHCTYSEAGVPKEGLIVSRFDNAIIADQYNQSQTWTVSLQVMVAPPGELMKNASFIRQATTFFTTAYITPEYFHAINKVTMTSAQINREAALQQGETIVKSYWERQKSNDASAQNFSDYMRGVGRYTDPNGGPAMVLPEGPQYWVARDGSIIAADDPNYDPNTSGGGSYSRMRPGKG